MLASFMPIAILLLIIGFVILIVFKMPKKGWRSSYTTGLRRLFIVYSAVLILAVPAALMLPETSDAPGEEVNAPVHLSMLQEMAQDGNIDEDGQIYQQKSWDLPTDKQNIKLEMVSGNDPYTDIPVFAERVSDKHDTIHAVYYRSPLIAEKRDLSEQLPLLNVQYKSGTIRINVPTPFSINIATFTQEFPISQFMGDEEDSLWTNEVTKGGEQLIYLKIPEDVQLDALEGMRLHYVAS